MKLTYTVPTGRYGVRENLNVNDTTFGTQGATVCVILLVRKNDGTLFCGHMDCGYSGQPNNKEAVTQKTTELLNNTLNGEEASDWSIGGSGGDPTHGWMRAAITTWFNNAPSTDSNEPDGCFIRQAEQTNILFDRNREDGTNLINTGPFSVEP